MRHFEQDYRHARQIAGQIDLKVGAAQAAKNDLPDVAGRFAQSELLLDSFANRLVQPQVSMPEASVEEAVTSPEINLDHLWAGVAPAAGRCSCRHLKGWSLRPFFGARFFWLIQAWIGLPTIVRPLV